MIVSEKGVEWVQPFTFSKTVVSFLTLLLFSFNSFSQVDTKFSGDIDFANYLIDNHEYRDAIFVLSKLNTNELSKNITRSDSLNYYLGWAYFQNKSLDTSAAFFGKVYRGSAFYYKSRFYGSFSHTFSHRTTEAKTFLSEIGVLENPDHEKLRIFQYSGIALLERDYAAYDSLSKKFDPEFYPLAEEQKNFGEYSKNLRKIKRKSPVVAGALSAVVPGLGKYYAGYKMQGLAAFLQVGTFGAAAAESYFKKSPQAGLKSARFIVFGSLFSIFYVGNIWGSALSVQVKREERFNEIDQSILFDLRIPMRRIFN